MDKPDQFQDPDCIPNSTLEKERELLFGEKWNNLKEDKLEEVAGERKNDAKDDLNKSSLLFVLFV